MPTSDATVEAIAGATGAVIATFATFPLNTVSVNDSILCLLMRDGEQICRFLSMWGSYHENLGMKKRDSAPGEIRLD